MIVVVACALLTNSLHTLLLSSSRLPSLIIKPIGHIHNIGASTRAVIEFSDCPELCPIARRPSTWSNNLGGRMINDEDATAADDDHKHGEIESEA